MTPSVEAIVDPETFERRADSGTYELRRQVSVVSLIAPTDAVIHDGGAAAKLRAVPSVYDVLGDLSPGTRVDRTVDLFTSPGFLYLVADSEDEIERDYKLIRELEQDGLYAQR